MKAVTLLSGGLDSTLVTTMAVDEFGSKNVSALIIDYGQEHSAELVAAEKIAEYFSISSTLIRLDDVFENSSSALIDADVEIPNVSYDSINGISPMYVPFRNGTFISAATAYALSIGAEFVMIGAHAEDARRWAYPDCSPEFIGAMTAAVYIGTYAKVRLVTPLLTYTKVEVVKESLRRLSPIHLTRSCYSSSKDSCGVCPTCRSRLDAFEAAGKVDPITYQDR